MTSARKSGKSVIKSVQRESAFNGSPVLRQRTLIGSSLLTATIKPTTIMVPSPYLNLEFFTRLGKSMPENVLLILALQDGKPLAAAFCLHNARTLYGRYWGAMQYIPGLHFETCYYQAIEYCIANGIALFEGGAQGEHKLARGFLPVRTWSAHWLAHPEFASAIRQHVEREAQGMDRYLDELNDSSPFRKDISK